MKRYAHIYCFVCLVSVAFSLYSCRSKKTVQRYEGTATRIERIETFADTSRTEQRESDSERRASADIEKSYVRTTDYDSVGNIRRVQEEWRDRRSADVAIRDRQGESFSVTGSESKLSESDNSTTEIEKKEDIQADSRPVQGTEWVWVILSIALVLTVVFYFISKKRNKWPL